MRRITYLFTILCLSLLLLPQAASAASFTTSASANPASAASGTTITITGVVNSSAATKLLVDLELYSPNGQKIFQQAWDNQSFSAGQTRNFSASWAVPSNSAVGNYTIKIGIFKTGWASLLFWNDTAGKLAITSVVTVPPTPTATKVVPPTPTATKVVPPTPTATKVVPPTATPIVPPTATPIVPPTATSGTGRYFTTLPPGSVLPSESECAAAIKRRPENKRMNVGYNATRGGPKLASNFFGGDPRSNTQIGPRVTGNFSGTTDEILQWSACKWGIDENIVRAQAAVESWWEQTTLGDWTSDASRCAPGHGLGVDGQAGQCPESWGILQNRYPYEQSAWPGFAVSTAYNADTTYAIWRACYEGYDTWLNDVERGQQYGAGDAMGCVGRWFAGRWHTQAANDYSGRVQSYIDSRIWEQATFQEP